VYRVLRGEIVSATAPIEMLVTSATGRELTLQVSGAPLRDADGQLMGAVVVTRDVTLQRRLEQQRMDIFRVVAHDLANPLAAIKLFLQLQQRMIERGRAPSAPDPEVLATMVHEVVRMERLLSDMHAVVGLESNKLVLDRKPFDLVTLCQQEVRPMQMAETRELHVNLPDGPVMVEADRDRIGQVLANLLSNADKYSPVRQPITLTLRLERGAPNAPNAGGSGGSVATDATDATDATAPQQACVLVHDAGPGIPENEQERIWERFHRVQGVQAQTTKSASLGLGLYISRQIIEQHGGAIGVESAPGVGSTFWFTLPLAPSD
jgi:signal transduction histidine kinase